jgi:hypothetical protein
MSWGIQGRWSQSHQRLPDVSHMSLQLISLHLCMRFVALLLALLVLGLSLVPCADAQELANGVQAKETSKTHSKQAGHQESCSPFCHCACCAGFSITHEFAEVISQPLIHSTQYNSSYIPEILDISLPVWQPPQLG